MPIINLRNAKDYKRVCATLNGDQPKALEVICDWLLDPTPNYFILSGYAGTGKTYLTAAVTRLAQQIMWGHLAVTNPTHQAKMNIIHHLNLHGVNLRSEMIGVDTIHSFLGLQEEVDDDGKLVFKPSGKTKYKDGCDLLIVDEYSMIGEELDGYIEYAHTQFNGKVLFVGDHIQIPPVGERDSKVYLRFKAGDKKFSGYFFLNTVVRQSEGSSIISIATAMREHLEKGNILLRYPTLDDFIDNDQLFRSDGIRNGRAGEIIRSAEVDGHPKFMKALAYKNISVDKMNGLIKYNRAGLGTPANSLPLYQVGESLILIAPWMDESGKQVILPNNSEVIILEMQEQTEGEGDYTYTVNPLVVSCPDVLGSETVLIKPTPTGKGFADIVGILKDTARIYPKGSYQAKTAWMDYYGFVKQYVPVKYSYAITAHRSQGSTYGWVILEEADIFSNSNRTEAGRIAYTAITRASQGAVVLRNPRQK